MSEDEISASMEVSVWEIKKGGQNGFLPLTDKNAFYTLSAMINDLYVLFNDRRRIVDKTAPCLEPRVLEFHGGNVNFSGSAPNFHFPFSQEFVGWTHLESGTHLFTLSSDDTAQVGTYFYTHDLTKNVCELIDTDLNISQTYDYSPFGEVSVGIPAGGSLIANPFRFSSEVSDSELGLVYYNYRHYNPTDGRWLSRDPIEEQGGLNLYGMTFNNTSNYVDVLGFSVYIAVRNFNGSFFNFLSNHTFLLIIPNDMKKLRKCCPDLIKGLLTGKIRDINGKEGFTLGGFKNMTNGDLEVMYSDDKDMQSVQEGFNSNLRLWWKPDLDFQSREVIIPGNGCEEKFICDLLKFANYYNTNPVKYGWKTTNCTNWARSILYSLGIEEDADFNGIDWNGGELIESRRFNESLIPSLPPIISNVTPSVSPIPKMFVSAYRWI